MIQLDFMKTIKLASKTRNTIPKGNKENPRREQEKKVLSNRTATEPLEDDPLYQKGKQHRNSLYVKIILVLQREIAARDAINTPR